MSKTSYLQIAPGTIEAYYGVLQPGDRFIFPRIHPKTVLISQQKVAGIAARSLLPACKAAWALLSSAQKTAWKNADYRDRKHGWQWFVADKSQRIKLGYPGNATPTSLHNSTVGLLQIDAPAEEIKIIQPHPAAYYVMARVPGTKAQYSPSFVNESFGTPFEIGLNYTSNLTSTGAGSFARFFARVRHLYQGLNLDYDLIVELTPISGWIAGSATLPAVLGVPISYNLYFHIYKMRGTLMFDNLTAEHSGSNWARDPYCKNIAQSFSRAYYQIPKHWAAVTVPDGAGFESIYPT